MKVNSLQEEKMKEKMKNVPATNPPMCAVTPTLNSSGSVILL